MTKEDFDNAITGLQLAQAEGINLLIDSKRRQALYPDLESMEKRTREIMFEQAAIPINECDKDIVHLLYHIDMLKKELKKKDQ